MGLVVFVALYLVLATVAPIRAFAAADVAQDRIATAAVQPAWPKDGSAIVGELDGSGALVTHGDETEVPIASMTKTITALMMLNKYPITGTAGGPTITFTQNDVDILAQVQFEEGSWAPVVAGEQLTLRQALTAMLLPSANNYAISLADWAYGSVPNYLTATNAWLVSQGFTHTHITDPSGLDPGTVSDLSDLLGIGRLVEKNPVLAGIVAMTQVTLPDVGTQQNTNSALGTDGIVGIKTGYTNQAGHCLMFAADATIFGKKTMLVGVLTGQSSYSELWAGVPKLLDSVKKGFHSVDVTQSGARVFGTFDTPWGQSTTLVAATDPQLDVWSNTPIAVSVKERAVVSGPAGTDAGTVTFSAGGRSVSAPLVTTSELPGPGFWWRITHPKKLF